MLSYKKPDKNTEYGVEWNSWGWCRFERPPGGDWKLAKHGLDEASYKSVIESHGLSDYSEQLPMEEVASMSPSELDTFRLDHEVSGKIKRTQPAV